ALARVPEPLCCGSSAHEPPGSHGLQLQPAAGPESWLADPLQRGCSPFSSRNGPTQPRQGATARPHQEWETQPKAEVWTLSPKVWLDFPVHFFTEKTPQLFKDNSTITSPLPILLFHHTRAAEELSLRCIQSPGFPSASASLNIREWLHRVSSSSSSLAPFTLELARMLLFSAAPYPLTEGSNHQLWMGQRLRGWRN
ncbi:unnamed protein product, partial [Tetraodon nigroviridis]